MTKAAVATRLTWMAGGHDKKNTSSQAKRFLKI
jgi:hypothetical protein